MISPNKTVMQYVIILMLEENLLNWGAKKTNNANDIGITNIKVNVTWLKRFFNIPPLND